MESWENLVERYGMFPENRGVKPPKWMVYNGKPENPIKMDDLGVPLFLETPICLSCKLPGYPESNTSFHIYSSWKYGRGNAPPKKETILFQASIFRGKLAVSFREVTTWICLR